ncbi:MAG: flagellar basal body-associated FliL family protein [Desulfocapsaceae bacterium]|nr:flagellar basal body-associated FliL family protein [Desulfocapsaceae bacterium]
MAEKKGAQKAPETPKAGGKKKLIIIIAAALLIILIGTGIAAYFLLKDNDGDDANSKPGANVPVPDLTQETDIGPMVNIDEFIVNIISAENNHYVKAAITLELTSETAKEETNMRMPQIRDAILLLVGNKTYDELQDLQGKKQLKAELSSKLNSLLQTGRIKAIYFTDFVVQ